MNTAIKAGSGISMTDLRKQDSESVWVLNTSDEVLQNNQRGDIRIPVTTESEDTMIVTIPATWIPIDVSGQLPKADVMKSVYFRRMVDNGFLRIIGDEDARSMMSDRAAKVEAETLKSKLRAARADSVASGVVQQSQIDSLIKENPQLAEVLANIAREQAKAQSGQQSDGGRADTVKAGAFVVDLFTRKDINDDERYSAIRKQEKALSNDDWLYVMQNAGGDNLKALASSKLKLS